MYPYFSKMRGGAECPPSAPLRLIMLAGLGGLLAIAAVAYLADVSQMPLVLGSFGASCVLLFGFPDSPFSQPRNVIAGHFLASLIGLIFLSVLGAHWWSMALATGTAIAAMQLTRTVHPPAGSNPVIVMLTSPTWGFLLTPTLLGAIVVVMVAVIVNNIPKERAYPKYWL
jgi:CBS-domain-containing membrane protein